MDAPLQENIPDVVLLTDKNVDVQTVQGNTQSRAELLGDSILNTKDINSPTLTLNYPQDTATSTTGIMTLLITEDSKLEPKNAKFQN